MKIVTARHDSKMYSEDGYWFLLRHGLGPGTIPKDTKILDHVEDGWKDYVKLDRFLTTDELHEFDIREACPPAELVNIPIKAAIDASYEFVLLPTFQRDVKRLHLTDADIDELKSKLTTQSPEASLGSSVYKFRWARKTRWIISQIPN